MNYKSIFLLLFFLTITTISIAAPFPPPPPPGNGPPCWPPPCVIPIDGGISILMAAGAALGAKKIYDSRKKKDSVD